MKQAMKAALQQLRIGSHICNKSSCKCTQIRSSLGVLTSHQLWAATHLLAAAQLALTGGSFRKLCLLRWTHLQPIRFICESEEPLSSASGSTTALSSLSEEFGYPLDYLGQTLWLGPKARHQSGKVQESTAE